MTFTAAAIAFFLATVLVSAFYQYAVRPVLIRSLMFNIFAKRDMLRRLAITDDLSPKSKEFVYLQDFLCKAIALFPQINVWRFCLWAAHARGESKDEAVVHFENCASYDLRKLRHEAVEDVIGILILNSPITTGLALLVWPFLWIVGKARSVKIFQATEGFVHNLQPA